MLQNVASLASFSAVQRLQIRAECSGFDVIVQTNCARVSNIVYTTFHPTLASYLVLVSDPEQFVFVADHRQSGFWDVEDS